MVLKIVIICCLATLANGQNLESSRKPLYKYRYETEDLKTAASGIPVHGYHLVEGGYYPEPRFGNFGGQLQRPLQSGYGFNGGIGLRQPLIGAGGLGAGQVPIGIGGIEGGGLGAGQAQIGIGGIGGGGLGAGQSQIGIGGIGGGGLGYHGVAAGIQPHIHPVGGESIDKSVYQDGSQAQKDATFKNAQSSNGVQGSSDQEGFQRGEAQIRNGKGDTASYEASQGQKQTTADGKNYQGAQHFNQQGQNAGEQNQKQGHKKGHVVKGFKTSHHKDESGKTEEYYDESNDEGGHFMSKGSKGNFGEQAKNAYQGGHDAGQFNSGESSKHGHTENIHHVDNANADKGDYAQKQTFGQGQSYGVNNGVDQQSVLGHQESNRFFKHHPIHTPFYKAY